MSVQRFRRGPVPDSAVLDVLRGTPSSTVSDVLGRTGAIAGLAPIGDRFLHDPSATLVGRALTVRTRPGGNLAVHAALEAIEAGDVLVLAGGGDMSRAIVGEMVVLYAAARGAVGIVVDGAVRDVAAIALGPIPVFARGATPLGPHRDGPGALHATVVCGGVPIRDGDVLVGDADGIVVVPHEQCPSVAVAARTLVDREEKARPSVVAGRWARPWLDGALDVVDAPDA